MSGWTDDQRRFIEANGMDPDEVVGFSYDFMTATSTFELRDGREVGTTFEELMRRDGVWSVSTMEPSLDPIVKAVCTACGHEWIGDKDDPIPPHFMGFEPCRGAMEFVPWPPIDYRWPTAEAQPIADVLALGREPLYEEGLPCSNCGCPGCRFDGHVCADYLTEPSLIGHGSVGDPVVAFAPGTMARDGFAPIYVNGQGDVEAGGWALDQMPEVGDVIATGSGTLTVTNVDSTRWPPRVYVDLQGPEGVV